MRPRVGIPNRESHGQTVRVGRSEMMMLSKWYIKRVRD